MAIAAQPNVFSTISSVPGEDDTFKACSLIRTSFGWWLQAFLGLVCFISLVGKRFTDEVRRPWKIWFFDTSKQACAAVIMHFGNIFLAMAFGEFLDAGSDPCNWYWINLTLDDTLGVLVIFSLLRLLQCTYRLRCVNRPQLALSGEYGDPPDLHLFARQLLDFQGIVVVEKLLLACLVVRFPHEVASIANVLLGWLDLYPRIKLMLVMAVSPLVMNVFALWVGDSFLQGGSRKPLHSKPATCEGGTQPDVVGNKCLEGTSGEDSERSMYSFSEWKAGHKILALWG